MSFFCFCDPASDFNIILERREFNAQFSIASDLNGIVSSFEYDIGCDVFMPYILYLEIGVH